MKISSTNRIRVLLADDHVVVRAGIRQFLEQDPGIQIVSEASNGLEALDLIEEFKPDVAVLDIQMPKMSGIDVTRWIRKQNLPIGILVLTAYDDEPYVQAVLRAGANGYVLKTAEPQAIVDAVKDVFQGKSVLDSALAQKLFHKISAPASPAMSDPLTDRELQIIALTARGYTNKAIGVQLSISDRTVQNHLANIFKSWRLKAAQEL